jgi:hypothetical protein
LIPETPTDNGPEDDFEAFARRRPGFNLTETEDPESLGDRDLDRLCDWPITSFDKYDFDDNGWTRSKAEFPCEQVVAVNSSPDTLNPLQRELYEMAVQQYLDELAGRDVKPLRLNLDGVAGSGKT